MWVKKIKKIKTVSFPEEDIYMYILVYIKYFFILCKYLPIIWEDANKICSSLKLKVLI